MIVILVPELEALLAEAGQVPQRLAAILARGQRRALDEDHFQSELLCGQALSPAALSRWRDCPNDADGTWLRADPVALRPDLNAVWVQAGLDWPGPESPDAASVASLIEELQQLFVHEGLVFDPVHPGRGYLRLDHEPDCRFWPPWALSGQSMDHLLPTGPTQQRWRRLLNECQMLMHQAGQRSDASLPQGLWFWGAGSLPGTESVKPRVSHVESRDPVLLGLADWLKLSHAPVPNAVLADHSLVEWMAEPARDAIENLQTLDQWLAPAWRRLRRAGIDALELASTRQAWSVCPSASWRLWRRTMALPA